MWVFGSVARGNEGPESDVDILVEFSSGVGLLEHVVLLMDLAHALGCRVDVVSKSALRGRARDQILGEAVSLFWR